MQSFRFITQEELYDSLERSKAVCLDLHGITLEGTNVNDVFDRVTVKFMLCLDSNNDNTCCECLIKRKLKTTLNESIVSDRVLP